MISHLLHDIKNKSAQEIQFRLGHLTLIRVSNEWVQLDNNELSLSEWEDLKDLCLQSSEKITLETKGFVRGIYTNDLESWSFTFTDWKDCMKAYFTYMPRQIHATHLSFSAYWESIKARSGIHIVSGQKSAGKSIFMSQIAEDIRKHSPELIGVHSPVSNLSLLSSDSIIHLGVDSIAWDSQHPLFDGIDTFIVDLNQLQHLEKWIHFSEEGRKIFITISSSSLENALLQLRTETQSNPALWKRLCEQLMTVSFQKCHHQQVVNEVVVLKHLDQKKLSHYDQDEPKKDLTDFIRNAELRQSLNQALIQALVRRRIDVKTAFILTNDPEDLDQNLKRMGI